ncbi:MAG: phosphatase PAP2 family protein [Ignisphaera sp.]
METSKTKAFLEMVFLEVVALAIFTAIVGAGILRNLDSSLYNILRIGNTSVVSAFSETGSIYIFVAIVVALFIADLIRYRRITLFTAGLALLFILNSALVSVLKISLQIPRPITSSNNSYANLLEALDVFSYPSGHAARAFAIASYYSTSARKQSRIVAISLYMWAIAIAFSRLLLGVHWFSDVIGGVLVGILSTHLVSMSLPHITKTLPKKIIKIIII